MNEEEWLRASSPTELYRLQTGPNSERKRRLFACSCCRRKWKWFVDHRSRHAVEVSELFADDSDQVGALDWALQTARIQLNETRHTLGYHNPHTRVARVACAVAQSRLDLFMIGREMSGVPIRKYQAMLAESRHQADLYRDIFGNPFRPVAVDPAWRTEAAVGLAAGIYEDRAFERMPILADSLEEAGCEHADILTHCREPGTHVRGCWVVDLVLGKE